MDNGLFETSLCEWHYNIDVAIESFKYEVLQNMIVVKHGSIPNLSLVLEKNKSERAKLVGIFWEDEICIMTVSNHENEKNGEREIGCTEWQLNQLVLGRKQEVV